MNKLVMRFLTSVEATYNEYFRAIEILEKRMGDQEFKLFIQLLKKSNKILSEE
ncbi:hypothetical protein LGK97_14930 [Clostridium sp. CS001]|uniref:hypothetical protein n=1 Tax=Clostridium sp. CS001 TaxID=2880648 RepID=UPI001CF38C3E|nr:hypothetical protein [Clostridium sp. CS001]MCB2291028.1 hypothetical protein [Clostridium sp. CS001]